MRNIPKYLWQHKVVIFMLALNILLFVGIFLMPKSAANGIPELLQIPVSPLVVMSSFITTISVLFFLAVGWWVVKKYPHPKSHGFFKFVLIFLVPAIVLGISSVSVSPEVPKDAFQNMEVAIAHFEQSEQDPAKLIEGFEKLRQGLAVAHKGQVAYYLKRMHQAFYFLFAAFMNLIFAIGFHLKCISKT